MIVNRTWPSFKQSAPTYYVAREVTDFEAALVMRLKSLNLRLASRVSMDGHFVVCRPYSNPWQITEVYRGNMKDGLGRSMAAIRRAAR